VDRGCRETSASFGCKVSELVRIDHGSQLIRVLSPCGSGGRLRTQTFACTLIVEPLRAIRLTVTLKCLKVALLPKIFGVGLGVVVADLVLPVVPPSGPELVVASDGGEGATVEVLLLPSR
jgi:hypothetical protein